MAPAFQGTCPTSSVFAGILYAADIGLPIINMSLGGNFNRRDAAFPGAGPSFIATIDSVFDYARQKGTTIVVSAGNLAIDMQHDGNGYKTYCDAPHVVCVSATGPEASPAHGTYVNVDALAPYSNFGGKVTVAAPGGAGRNACVANPVPNLGWVYAVCSGFSIVLTPCQARTYNPNTGAWSSLVIGLNEGPASRLDAGPSSFTPNARRRTPDD